MKNSYDKTPQIPFIRRICAHLSEEEIEAAEARFMRYVAICMEIESELSDDQRKAIFDRKQSSQYDEECSCKGH